MQDNRGADDAGLGIVVVNYGSSELLAVNLAAAAAACPEATVVVVDNPTTADERTRITDLAERSGWHLVPEDVNVGFGTGMNHGVAAARRAGATRFLLLNPDARIDAHAVGVLGDAVIADPLLLVSPAVHRPDGGVWFAGADLYLRTGLMRSRRRREPGAEVREWLSGACLMVSADLWDACGGFSDTYFLYWEDVDLSARVLEAGGRLEVREDAVAVHDEGATHRTGPEQLGKSPTYYYFNTRNRLQYAVDHLDRATVGRWLLLAPWCAWQILLQGGRRQLLHPVAPVGAAARGTLAGTRIAAAHLLGRPVRLRAAGDPRR
ncbi:glycosyltransferase [Tersicoccus sp. Bi-70]|uniref:glycosyltransferase n=1 Tax=Tersicoccus sp. Bi-70 TaxID=1897634 RepID=UPI000978A1E9|nr:glycosyltransferase family 2 protein [Tersicoccus sp. Bi-70]OMH31368.1 hypothetical protein BGP79_10155 [Tersicoccus sp. Bi-70]